MSDVTQILSRIDSGDPAASEELLPLVYHELRRLAASRLAQESPGQTLQATALVHEAYLRLLGDAAEPKWHGRAHFFGAAAEAMRRILVENARRKLCQKHGGKWHRHDLKLVAPAVPGPNVDLLALDDALTEFAVSQPVKAELVKLRFFAGLTLDQAAEVLGISTATADRYWKFARGWLASRVGDGEPAGHGESGDQQTG